MIHPVETIDDCKPSLISLLEMAAIAARNQPYLVFPLISKPRCDNDVKSWIIPKHGKPPTLEPMPRLTGEQVHMYLTQHIQTMQALKSCVEDEQFRLWLGHFEYINSGERERHAYELKELKEKHTEEKKKLENQIKGLEASVEFWKVRFGDTCK